MNSAVRYILHESGEQTSETFTHTPFQLLQWFILSQNCNSYSMEIGKPLAIIGFRGCVLLGKMIISLSMNITMNQLGGASVIAKFHS